MDEVDFKGVEDTLFIPLAARVLSSRRFPEYFYDEKSLELENLQQVKKINENSTEYNMLASVSRYFVIDKIVKSFLKTNQKAIVVNLGAGFETMNYRLKSYGGHFYQIDFDKVIEYRQKLLGKIENETFIKCDITDLTWAKKLDKDKPVLLVASGVFQYFRPEIVSEFLKNLKNEFQNAHLIFDATDEAGIEYAQKYVRKTGNKTTMMYFYINDAEKFCENENIELILERGFFKEAQRDLRSIKLYTKIAMKVVEYKKRVKLLYVKL